MCIDFRGHVPPAQYTHIGSKVVESVAWYKYLDSIIDNNLTIEANKDYTNPIHFPIEPKIQECSGKNSEHILSITFRWLQAKLYPLWPHTLFKSLPFGTHFRFSLVKKNRYKHSFIPKTTTLLSAGKWR